MMMTMMMIMIDDFHLNRGVQLGSELLYSHSELPCIRFSLMVI